MVDIQQELLPLNFFSSKHFNDKALMKEYENAYKQGSHERYRILCACVNPLRQTQVFCGDNKGFIHIVDISKS